MTDDSSSSGEQAIWRVLPGAATLTLVMGVVALASIAVYSSQGVYCIFAIVIAASTAYLGAMIALCMAASACKGPRAINWLLGATLFRFGFPLAVGVLSEMSGGPLANAGLFGWIVVFFLIGLAVETPFAVRLIQRAPSSTRSA